MTMLAQITSVSPNFLWEALVFITWAAMIGATVYNAATSRRTQKREVSMSENHVSAEFCKEQHSRLTKEIETMAVNRRSDTRDLHEKVNLVSNLVSAQGAKLDLIAQRITEMDRKIDRNKE
jgi:hypothetical protein